MQHTVAGCTLTPMSAYACLCAVLTAAGQAAVDSTGAVFYIVPAKASLVFGTVPCPQNYWCGPGNVSVLSSSALPHACINGLGTAFTGNTNASACGKQTHLQLPSAVSEGLSTLLINRLIAWLIIMLL